MTTETKVSNNSIAETQSKEIWKDVPGYEGLYLVSDKGRVKSLMLRGKPRNKLMDTHLSLGYKFVGLFKNSKKKNFSVHQLVAIAFLNHERCGSELVVDHIDNCKLNNNLSNLQVVSSRVNTTKDRTGGTSKYVGVCWYPNYQKWKAAVTIDRERINLGYYKSEINAHKAYVKAVRDWEEFNIKPNKRITTSNYKGVTFNKKRGKWKSYFTLKGKVNYVGYFDTEKEAFVVKEKAKELKLLQLQE